MNMSASLIKTLGEFDERDPQRPKVPGRIITTVPKAKELRGRIEKLITLARKSLVHRDKAASLYTTAAKGSPEFKAWRESPAWLTWNQAIAPLVNAQRRAFAVLRDKEAVRILFEILAPRFVDRPGGYTRVVRIAAVRLGDGGAQALIEFVGQNDRSRRKKKPGLKKSVAVSAPAPVASAPQAQGEAAGA